MITQRSRSQWRCPSSLSSIAFITLIKTIHLICRSGNFRLEYVLNQTIGWKVSCGEREPQRRGRPHPPTGERHWPWDGGPVRGVGDGHERHTI
jgi:hypothetical protein